MQNFVKLLSSQKDDNWPLPMMYAICLDLRKLAAKADRQLQAESKGSKPGATLEKAAEHMMSCFRTCALDSKSGEDVTKRWGKISPRYQFVSHASTYFFSGMLNIVNQLFKIYFRVNKLHLCKPLIRAIESSPLKDRYRIVSILYLLFYCPTSLIASDRYPLAQQITYKYYVGRKFMFDNDFPAAERYLSYAFEHCHRESKTNKRSILIYLIPVKMSLGHMPSQAVLEK